MAVSKLVAVTIAGKIGEFERIVGQYIYRQDIHLENVMSVLGDREKLQPFNASDPYEAIIQDADEILKLAKITPRESDKGAPKMTLYNMREFIEGLKKDVEEGNNERKKISKRIEELEKAVKDLKNIKNVNCDLSKLRDFSFIKYRFGHIPREGYKMLGSYLSDMDIVFYKTNEDQTGVWGFYFTPASEKNHIDEILASLYFERIKLPEDMSGTPGEMIEKAIAQIDEAKKKLDEISANIREKIKDSKDTLLAVYRSAKLRHGMSEVRRMAAHTDENFYIVGWMSKKGAKKLELSVKGDEGITLFYTQKPENLKGKISPPTKLKNNILFRPFESFVKMYGYPGYNEIDPTPLLAFTYILFFGMMFGDVGQSAVLAAGGFLIYKKTRMPLANIIGIVGLSGMIFGVLYGSVFGNEEIIHGVIEPMNNINTLLIGTMAMGAVVIVIGMILNIINCVRRGDIGNMLFSHNGIAGLIFYVSVLALVLAAVVPGVKMPGGVLSVLIAVSLLVIFLCEPLSGLFEGKKFPSSPMFYIQSLFELVEILLSYFSNTISFLRIGAFAIVHVGMMMAVSVMASGGAVKAFIVTVIGNILVMVLEGLVVGIQVLRLEYYEMFSRYFTGNGKPFESLKKSID